MDVKNFYHLCCGQFWADMKNSNNKIYIVENENNSKKNLQETIKLENELKQKGEEYYEKNHVKLNYYYEISNVDRSTLLNTDNYVMYHFDNGENYYELIYFKILDRIIDENNNLILVGEKQIL
jgi:hypothetical protein